MKLVEGVYRIKQVEARLQEISVISTEFKTKTREIAETIQGQLTWLETNKEILEIAPVKSPKRLQLKYDLMNIGNRSTERLIEEIEKTSNKCEEFYKKVLITHNKCHTSSAKRLQEFLAHENT